MTIKKTKESRVLTALQEGRTHCTDESILEQVTYSDPTKIQRLSNHQILLLTQKAEAETFTSRHSLQEQLLAGYKAMATGTTV